MAGLRHIQISEVGDITVVRFLDRKILDTANIEELSRELQDLVEQDHRKQLLLNFSEVDFLSSAALTKLLKLDKTVKKAGGQLKLTNIRTEIKEVFAITKLTRVFDIREDEKDALVAF